VHTAKTEDNKVFKPTIPKGAQKNVDSQSNKLSAVGSYNPNAEVDSQMVDDMLSKFDELMADMVSQ